ncbi:MAG: ABC transporter ATP-binding protein/permease [Myxococcales bacterium]|nr:ABC transporter ATP-binding protein/permease [Myxococcales bacterium]
MSDDPSNGSGGRTRAESAFEATVEQEILLWGLEHLAHCHGASYEPSKMRAAVLEAQRDLPGPLAETWHQRLAVAAPSAGLALTEVTRPVAELLTVVSRDAHLLMWCEAEGEPQLIAITERAGRKVKVASSAGGGSERWLDPEHLCALLDARGPAASVRAVFAELAAPLEALRAHDEAGHADDTAAPPPPLPRLRSLLKTERADLWVVVAYAVGVGVMSLATPVAVQSLVNTVAFGTLLQPLVVLALILLACLGIVTLLRSLQYYVVEMIQRRVFVRAAADLAYRLPRVRLDAYEGKYGPELVNRFFDVVTVQKSAAQLLIEGLGLLLQLSTGLLLLAFYHPVLLAFAGLLIAGLAFVIFVMGRGGITYAIKESKAKYAMAAWLEELARHPASFKTAGGLSMALGRADALAKEYLLARKKQFGVVMRQLVGGLTLQAVSSTVLLGVGGWLVIQRQLTLGQLVAAELILTSVVAGFTKLGKTLDAFYKLVAAVDKLGVLIDLPLEKVHGEALPPRSTPAAVSFRAVSYCYVDGRPALSNVSFELKPGERVALVGGSGAGKGTLLDLAFGLRRPSSGAVLVDGLDVRDVRIDALRKDVVMLNGVEIIEGTVADNVSMGRTDVSSTEIREALSRVGLLEDVLALPEGLNTHVVTGGSPLSGGQARRLMLARALVARPRLLLIRETLDTLAPDVRDLALSAVLGRQTPWTVLVVSHDRDVVAACDRAIELGGGRRVNSALARLTGTSAVGNPEIEGGAA